VNRSVSCHLSAELLAPSALELQVAVAGQATASEQLSVTVDGWAIDTTELVVTAGGRLHLARCGPGRLEVAYDATVVGRTWPVAVDPLDATTYLRPSRYAEADRLLAFAEAEFGHVTDPGQLVHEVAAWVNRRLSYVLGSSSGTDGAVDVLLAGIGVCRDYAHLTTALLRARDVPARLVSVYAPGLDPMDFHAVVEALVDGQWQVVDATRLAPRESLVRISTGRDAADTAFLSSYGGDLRLDEIWVHTVVEDVLPWDDHSGVVQLG
jgi:transglutaminase-like putative cysteine protease